MAALRDDEAEIERRAAHQAVGRRIAPTPYGARGSFELDRRRSGGRLQPAVLERPAEGDDTELRDVREA